MKTLLHIAALAILMSLSSLSMAGLDRNIKVVIEEPATGESYAGLTNLRGWAVSPAGTGRFYFNVYIDGEFAFYMPTGGNRADVADAYPSYPDSDQSGFSMAFNYKNLSPGTHEIRIRAYDNDDNYNDAVVSFTTERFDSEFINDASKVNLSAASGVSVIDQHTIVVEGAVMENRSWDFALKWDQASQSFKTEDIRPSSGGSIGGGQPPVGEDVYACVTSPDGTYYSSANSVSMRNGLELNNYDGRTWRPSDSHVVFKTTSGDWYTIENEAEGYRLDVIAEPLSCFAYDYGLVIDTYPIDSETKALVIENGEIAVRSSCFMSIGTKVSYYGSAFGGSYLVDLETAQRCEALAAQSN